MPRLAKFAFDLGDRVMIPDDKPLQGVVSARKQIMRNENEYDVHFLLPDLKMAHVQVPEAALIAVQPASPRRKKK